MQSWVTKLVYLKSRYQSHVSRRWVSRHSMKKTLETSDKYAAVVVVSEDRRSLVREVWIRMCCRRDRFI
jgi:hypothetical protein